MPGIHEPDGMQLIGSKRLSPTTTAGAGLAAYIHLFEQVTGLSAHCKQILYLLTMSHSDAASIASIICAVSIIWASWSVFIAGETSRLFSHCEPLLIWFCCGHLIPDVA
jgi:hypothetical protein